MPDRIRTLRSSQVSSGPGPSPAAAQPAAPARAPESRSGARRRQVRDALRRLLSGDELPPGARLVQHDLARRFGTSVGVVREVLLELASAGLVEREERRGFFIARYDFERLGELFAVRAVHEGLAARLCCERANRAELRRLKAAAAEIRRLGATADKERIARAAVLDRAFHAELIRIAGNRVLARVWESHSAPILVGRSMPAQCFARSHREHLALLRAIERGRPDDAERLARAHIRKSLEYIRRRIDPAQSDLAWYA